MKDERTKVKMETDSDIKTIKTDSDIKTIETEKERGAVDIEDITECSTDEDSKTVLLYRSFTAPDKHPFPTPPFSS